MENNCYNCEHSKTEDFCKGREALKCGKTGRVIVVAPQGHLEAAAGYCKPVWCKEEMRA